MRTAVLNGYKKMGDSTRTIYKIEKLISILANTKYKIESIVPNYLDRLLHVERTRSHIIIQLIEHDNFQVAVHFIPSRYEIKGHLHLNSINIVHVQQGELQIEQRSLSLLEETYNRTIKENQSCAGLFKLRNIHHLKSSGSPCVFLSFRIYNQTPQLHTIKKLFSIFTAGILFLLPSVIVQNSHACEQHTLNTTPHKIITSNKVTLANQLRKGEGVEKDLYKSAMLYQQEASKGNAEAQYWLGVMYFDGSGITDDSDEALRWIAMSSDQSYPPAQKLLNHLLTWEEIPDC